MPDSFSYRMGIKQKSPLQLKNMDQKLHDRLWYILKKDISRMIISREKHEQREKQKKNFHGSVSYYPYLAEDINRKYGLIHLKEDWIRNKKDLFDGLYKQFYKKEWYETFDLIEWLFDYILFSTRMRAASEINKVLKDENSGYRLNLLDELYQFVPITDDTEIKVLEDGLQTAENNKLDKLQKELSNAQKHCFDRKTPDYKASIQASFNACESAIKFYLEIEKGTMGKDLDKIPDIAVPKAMKEGFKKYYGYASQYVRHGQADNNTKTKEHDPSFEEAKFFLVATHAFCNYLIAKKGTTTDSK